MRFRVYLPIIVLIISFTAGAFACSTGIVSAGASQNGRPLLWKHRDARQAENDLRYFEGPDYDFIGLVNTEDDAGEQVWAGANEAGFAVMNANAYNLPRDDYKGEMDQDGFFMKEALGVCGTVDDFEKLVKKKQGGLGVIASFGVIDARGGAAYFEIAPLQYERFDATDPKVAPEGYLIRTNFGESGEKYAGSGYIRYDALEKLFEENEGALTAEFLLQKATRCLKHSILKTDLAGKDLPAADDEEIIVFRDYIVRGGSVSSMVVEGVKPGEDPALTTIWTIPAFQLASPAIPTWVAAGKKPPETIISKGGEPSYITEAALSLKKKAFPIPGRDGRSYVLLSRIMNRRGTGYYQRIQKYEDEIIARTNALLENWRKTGFNKNEARKFYDEIDAIVKKAYEEK